MKDEPELIPDDVMDFLCKAGAYLNNMIPEEKHEEIRKHLVLLVDILLEKYDSEHIR